MTRPTTRLPLVLVLVPALALARDVAAREPADSAGAPAASAITPLPELPALAPVERPAPRTAAVTALEARLDQLLAKRPGAAGRGAGDLAFLTQDLDADVPAVIAQRLAELKEAIRSERARALLDDARRRGRKERADAEKRRGAAKSSEDDEGDWLAFVLALDRPKDGDWRALVELFAMMRMLEAVGSTPAVRVMIDAYAQLGELVRIEVQRAVARLRDKAVAALIEAKQHDARKVQRWAARQLDLLGRALPGEAVSSTDEAVLADVLRAFGRIRDVDAVGVVLSFVGSERLVLRQAAREALSAIGEPAVWQLRDAYQSMTGQKPPRAWDWDRLARELFRLHDHARLATVYELWERGRASAEAKRWSEATDAFDQVLARLPLFEHRSAMVPAYRARGEELAASAKRAEALLALRKALRLGPAASDRPRIESWVMTLEAEELLEAGTPDRTLLERALEIDPDNARARELLATLVERATRAPARAARWVLAGIVFVAGLALAALIALRRPRKPSPPPTGECRNTSSRS
jgi:tetratricopeptide (TPR) repeat protein